MIEHKMEKQAELEEERGTSKKKTEGFWYKDNPVLPQI